jgi:hypothetical protein
LVSAVVEKDWRELEVSMKRIPECETLTFAILIFIASPRFIMGGDTTVAAGTLIKCTIDEPDFSTRTAQIDEPLVCYTRPVTVLDCDGLLEGSELMGRLTELKQPGRFDGKGWMKIEFDRLLLPQGAAPISAKVVSIRGLRVGPEGKLMGHGHPIRDAAEWAVPVLWPAKVATLPRRGPAPALRGERVVTLRLMDDIQVPCTPSVESVGSEWRPFGSDVWRSSPSRP